MSAPDRRAMLDRADRTLSLRRQCALVGVARSGVYRPGKPANDNDAALMRRIDELFTAWPFLGSRRMTAVLRADGVFEAQRDRSAGLARRRSFLDCRDTAEPAQRTPTLTIERANHVWAADITYILIGRGFLVSLRRRPPSESAAIDDSALCRESLARSARIHSSSAATSGALLKRRAASRSSAGRPLMSRSTSAIIDWASRAVLAWRLSNTMDVSFCLAALEEALAKFGRPEIFNTDSQRITASFRAA
jgi:transposase InsO family protein